MYISNKPGIIEKLRGKWVDVIQHPKYPQLYQFEYDGEKYMCSDYSFASPSETFDGDVISIIPLNKKRRQSGDNTRYNK